METMSKMRRKKSHSNNESRQKVVKLKRTANMWQRVVVVDVAMDGTERVGSSRSGLALAGQLDSTRKDHLSKRSESQF